MSIATGLIIVGTPDLPGTSLFEEALAGAGFEVVARHAIRAETAVIKRWIRLWADQERVPFVATVGGLGLGVMDVTPEAVREMLERDLAGIATMMQMGALGKTRAAALDRLVTGLRRKSIIVTFPADAQRQLIYLEVVRNTIARAVAELERFPAR